MIFPRYKLEGSSTITSSLLINLVKGQISIHLSEMKVIMVRLQTKTVFNGAVWWIKQTGLITTLLHLKACWHR